MLRRIVRKNSLKFCAGTVLRRVSPPGRRLHVIPAKAGIQYAAASRLIISSSAILDRPPSRAMTRSVTFACAPMRKQAASVVDPRRHTRESGYPVRRGPSIKALNKPVCCPIVALLDCTNISGATDKDDPGVRRTGFYRGALVIAK